ncbi:MAG: hypothetical protein FD167_373 [bacterium]|nr:MAG: hypothetical protein FD167_373 [bacterium]
MKKQQICFVEQVTERLNRNNYIKSLKQEQLVLARELVIIGQRLLEINTQFNSYRIEFDNTVVDRLLKKDFGSVGLENKDLEELAQLAMAYKKLSKLFKKYHKELVTIELEIITIKSNSSVSSNC